MARLWYAGGSVLEGTVYTEIWGQIERIILAVHE